MKEIYQALSAVEECFTGPATQRTPEQLGEVVERVNLLKCRTAQDVFREFSLEAAATKVREMTTARSSAERQRAAETVLDYGLGKPINRSISIGVNMGDATDEELINDIQSLLSELGFTSGEGTSARILIGSKEPEGRVPALQIQAESRVSGEVSAQHETSADLPGRQSGGQD